MTAATRCPRTALMAALLSVAAAAVQAQGAPDALQAQQEDVGAKVYRQTCAACHATGVANAPRIGDSTAWKPLIAEGQHVLTAHAWVGVRAMPPRGGNPALSLEEFSRATAYMARASGAGWPDPDAAMLARIKSEEQKRIKALAAKPAK